MQRLLGCTFLAASLIGQTRIGQQKLESLRQIEGAIRPETVRAGAHERAILLKQIIAESPVAAVHIIRNGETAARLRGLGAAEQDLEQIFTRTGPSNVAVADDFEHGNAVIQYEWDGVTAYAASDQGPAGACGSTVQLTGWRVGETAVVTSAVAVKPNAGALPGSCSPVGNQRVAVVLVYGDGGAPPSVPASDVGDLVFGSRPDSLKQQLLRASYNRMTMSGQVSGWYKLPRKYTCDETSILHDDAIAAATKDIDFTQYNRVIFYLHPTVRTGGNCVWAGLGTVGCSFSPATNPAQQHSRIWAWTNTTGMPLRNVTAHEFGHNLGLYHARSVQFPKATLEPDRVRAFYTEYGDPYSFMGVDGLNGFSAYHKAGLGWLTQDSEYKIVEQAGSFTLTPIQSAAPGVKAIRIRRGPGLDQWIWLEYQGPGIEYLNTTPPTTRATYARTIIRYETPETGAFSEVLASNLENPRLLYELAPGKVWRDAHSSLSIELGTAKDSALGVTVRYDTNCAQPASSVLTQLTQTGQQTSVQVNAPAGCIWSAESNGGWLSVRPSGYQTGPATLTVSAGANPLAPRSTSVTIGRQPVFFRQEGAVAAVSSPAVIFYPAELEVPATSGTKVILTVANPHDLAKTFVTNAPWLTISRLDDAPIGGPNNAPAWILNLHFDQNPSSSPRRALVGVGGYTATVTQVGAGVQISPATDFVGPGTATGVLSVQTSLADEAWKASSDSSWLQITDGANGSGAGSLRYSVVPNPSGQSRTGWILVGNTAAAITQTANGITVPPNYTVKLVAGGVPDGSGGPALQAKINRPAGLAFDSKGNLFISDRLRHMILRVAPDGTTTTYAGTGQQGGNGDGDGDGGSALNATLYFPDTIAIAPNDDVYFSNGGYAVRRIDGRGVITTVAGRNYGYSADGGPAIQANIYALGIALDRSGTLLIADTYNHRIRKVDSRGIITTIAGTGRPAFSGDNGPALQAELSFPEGIAVDPDGNILISDTNNNRVRKISADGMITTIAGTGIYSASGNGGLAVRASLARPQGLWVDGSGNILIGEYARVRRIRADGIIELVAGKGSFDVSGDEGPAVEAEVSQPFRVTSNATGNIYIADQFSSGVRQVTADGVIHRFAGMADSIGDGSAAPFTRLLDPRGVAADASGNTYIAEGAGRRIRQIGADGLQSTTAGLGLCCGSPDGSSALSARFNSPRDVLTLLDGSVLFSDDAANKIWKVKNGVISTWAGTGSYGYSGDGGPAAKARLAYPSAMAADAAGNIYFIDRFNYAIRKVDTSGVITTIAGDGTPGVSGDGGLATKAKLFLPNSIAVDSTGNVTYSENRYPQKIRRISTDGIIREIFANYALAIGLDPSGDLIILDFDGVQRLSSVTGSTSLTSGLSGETNTEVNAMAARFSSPTAIRVDATGRIFVVDGNDRVYVLTPR